MEQIEKDRSLACMSVLLEFVTEIAKHQTPETVMALKVLLDYNITLYEKRESPYDEMAYLTSQRIKKCLEE